MFDASNHKQNVSSVLLNEIFPYFTCDTISQLSHAVIEKKRKNSIVLTENVLCSWRNGYTPVVVDLWWAVGHLSFHLVIHKWCDKGHCNDYPSFKK